MCSYANIITPWKARRYIYIHICSFCFIKYPPLTCLYEATSLYFVSIFSPFPFLTCLFYIVFSYLVSCILILIIIIIMTSLIPLRLLDALQIVNKLLITPCAWSTVKQKERKYMCTVNQTLFGVLVSISHTIDPLNILFYTEIGVVA